MRGKDILSVCFALKRRITPAYAGKSSCALSFVSPAEDHPRVCGEKHKGPPVKLQYLGSPPRMRGKDSYQMCIGGVVGITPAHAGKSIAAAGVGSA